MINEIIYLGFLFLELIVSFSIAFYVASLLYSSLKGAPYVPTRMKEISNFLKEAGLKKGQVFIELGSGDGRVVRTAVKEYGVKGIGIEVNPVLIINARIQAYLQKIKNINFYRQDIFKTDLKEVDVVYLFLMPKLLEKLIPKFEKELKKKALIISHGFKIPGWNNKIKKTIEHNPFPTYFYIID